MNSIIDTDNIFVLADDSDSPTPSIWSSTNDDNDDEFLEAIRYGGLIYTKELLFCANDDDDMEEFVEHDDSSSGDQDDASASPSQTITTDDSSQEVKASDLIQFILPNGMKTYQLVEQEPTEEEESENNSYQELKLSDEEKRLLAKEGISLPSHYPLTKYEERELKRIRRKIRNKISAQDSRKRKKEFVDKLQQRLEQVEDEKLQLSKKVHKLEVTNSKLNMQIKKLQAALQQQQGKSSVNTTAATTLLVLILSLALVVIPTQQQMKQAGVMMSNLTSNALLDSSASVATNGNKSFANEVRTTFHQSRTMMSEKQQQSTDIFVEPPAIKIPRFSFYQRTTEESVGNNHGFHNTFQNTKNYLAEVLD